MKVFYKEGFMVMKSGRPGPVFVAPHSTTSLLTVTRGDINSELITARLVKKMGGFGVVSTIPRKGKYGVDYFRDAATMEEAVAMFKAAENSDYEARQRFEKQYAFFARDQDEYLEKVNVYNQFWTTVETLAPKNPLFIIIHTQATRLKNFPSMLDLITLSGRWMDEEKVREVMERINKEYEQQFALLKPELNKYAVEWADIYLRGSMNYRFNGFDINNIRGSFKTDISNDVKKAALLLNKDYKTLINNLNWDSYIELVKKCIKNTNFAITYQNAFDGSSGEARIGKLLEKCGGEALSLETSSFINELHPDVTVRLVQDIVSFIERREKLKIFEKFFVNKEAIKNE